MLCQITFSHFFTAFGALFHGLLWATVEGQNVLIVVIYGDDFTADFAHSLHNFSRSRFRIEMVFVIMHI